MVFLPIRRKEKESKKNFKNLCVDVSAKTGHWGVSPRAVEEHGGFQGFQACSSTYKHFQPLALICSAD